MAVTRVAEILLFYSSSPNTSYTTTHHHHYLQHATHLSFIINTILCTQDQRTTEYWKIHKYIRIIQRTSQPGLDAIYNNWFDTSQTNRSAQQHCQIKVLTIIFNISKPLTLAPTQTSIELKLMIKQLFVDFCLFVLRCSYQSETVQVRCGENKNLAIPVLCNARSRNKNTRIQRVSQPRCNAV